MTALNSIPGKEEHGGGGPYGGDVKGLQMVDDVGQDVDALLHREGEGVVARPDVVGHHFCRLKDERAFSQLLM